MTGRGKGLRAPTRISKTTKAGLSFPVGRVGRYLKDGRYSRRIGASAPIFLAAVLEYLCAELLELSGKACKDNSRKQITPRHIQLAVRQDSELAQLLRHVTISGGGVMPHIHAALLAKKK